MVEIIVARVLVIEERSDGPWILLVDSGMGFPALLPPNGVYECPGGQIEEGELPEEAALRELYEETGLRAGRLVKIGEYYNTVFFRALDIENLGDEEPDGGQPDADEIVDVRWFPLASVLQGPLLGHTTQAVLDNKEFMGRALSCR